MSIRTITRTYRHCDRCGYDDRENETTNFTEYPDGAGRALGQRIDLCDRCVEAGFVVFRGRIMQASEAEIES